MMKLRIAKKIYAGLDEWGNTRNRSDQLGRAYRRMNKTRSEKEVAAWWDETAKMIRQYRKRTTE